MSITPINATTEPTFFPQNIVEGQPDSDFLIYGVASSFAVPQWADLSKVKSCHHCKDSLKSSHSHNCRLCGHGFCSKCTSKNHLPEKYELKKGKQGPSRVCYTCKISCTRMRQAALNLPLDSLQRMIRPPTWQDIQTYIACNKCCVKRRSPHNCRLCGDLHCSDCTTKMNLNLPPAFNKKKKLGPQRVCDGCRYRITAGARLDDGTQEQIQTFLRQQSTGLLNLDGSTNTAVTTNLPSTTNTVLTNETGPIGSSIPTLRQHRLSLSVANSNGNSTPRGNIKIVYANTPNNNNNTRTIIVPQPSPLALSTPRENRMSISSHNLGTPQNNPHHIHEMEQITATLNSLSLNNETDGSHHGSSGTTVNNNGEIQLNHIQYDLGASGIPTTMATRTQRYAAAAASPTTPKNGPTASPNTASTPNPDRPFLDPMGEHLNLAMGASAQPRFRPKGGRDIFRALSVVQKPNNLATNSTINTPSKIQEQTLDDQKEGEMDLDNESLPPPPPPAAPSAVEYAKLVKPSDLFAKLRQAKE